MNAAAKKTVQVQAEVPLKRLGDMLISAFEGGSNYWYMIEEFHRPEHFRDYSAFEDRPGKFRHVDYPMNPGGYLIVSDAQAVEAEDVRRERLDLAAIRRGAQVMAEKYPRHWSDFLAENDDANTGDVFLQCCLYGEVIFG